ncbi:MAG: TIGR00725 family protein [Methanobacteriota archaeon]|nr:MAG: TIGR00725 family protein [Euryarchaeota archaeon]
MVQAMIGVIGASQADEELCSLAEKVGEGIAKRGGTVVCGGLTGVMEAVCRGARSMGGLTVGVLPSDDRLDANDSVDIPIVTGMGVARNVIIVRTADVLIAIGGQFGTLSEMAHALNMGKTVVALRSWDLGRISEAVIEQLVRVDTAEGAVDAAFQAVKREG